MIKYLTITILLLPFFACSQNSEIRLVNKQSNEWSYQDRFNIKLPKGYSFSSSIIMKNDSIKVGEVALANELLKMRMSGKVYLELNKTGGEFSTEETNYSVEADDGMIIKTDSIKIKQKSWYYDITRSDFEGYDDYGEWNSFAFANIENNRITIIIFYNKNLNDLNIGKYVNILSTIKYK